MALSGLGAFAGGMSRGIESGVGLVQQYEQIEKGRRRRDAAADLQELGTYDEWSRNNQEAIPANFQTAEADLTPGAQPLGAPGAIPDVMRRGTWGDYAAKRMAAFSVFAEDNPELYMSAEQDLENTRKHLLQNAVMMARSASDEEAAKILNTAYEDLVSEGRRPGNVQIVTDPRDGKTRWVKVGDTSMTFDQLGMLMTTPEAYAEFMQKERQLGQTDRQLDLTSRGLDIQEATREDQARLGAAQLALGQAELDSLNAFRQAELAQAESEHGTERAKVIGQRFDDIQTAQGAYLENLAAQDEEFFNRFGRDIPTVASALASADPSRSAHQLLSTAEWLLRTRDPGAFQRAMERSPGMQERWMVTAEDGSQVPAYRIEDGEVVITTGIGVDPRTGQEVEVIIDPIDGTPHIMTPALRRAFAVVENAGSGTGGATAAAAPGGAGAPAAGGALPEPPPMAPGAAAPDRGELLTRREQDLAELDAQIADLERQQNEQGYTSVFAGLDIATLRRRRRQLQEAITQEKTRQMQGKAIAVPGEQ